jgi:hypothetical protein
MFKFAAPLLAAVCLLGFASSAKADSFTLKEGFIDTAVSANPEFGSIGIATIGVSPDYLLGWTLILDDGSTTLTATHDASFVFSDTGNVSDIVRVNAAGAQIWSLGFVGGGGSLTLLSFLNQAFEEALSSSVQQVVGTPFFGGAGNLKDVGLVGEAADGTADLLGVFFGAVGAGGEDNIHVISSADGNGAAVPEPATLTLVGIGGAVAAYRRRRKTA